MDRSLKGGLWLGLRVRWRLSAQALLALAVVASGCADGQPRQRLVESFPDGSRVTVDIQFRIGGCVRNVEPVDCYYYMVTVESPNLAAESSTLSDGMGQLLHQARAALARGAEPAEVNQRFEDLTGESFSKVDALCRKVDRVRLRFYDAEGFSLYQHRIGLTDGNALEPGHNDIPDEVTSYEGVRKWFGRFPAESLSIRAFQSDISMRAELLPQMGCL